MLTKIKKKLKLIAVGSTGGAVTTTITLVATKVAVVSAVGVALVSGTALFVGVGLTSAVVSFSLKNVEVSLAEANNELIEKKSEDLLQGPSEDVNAQPSPQIGKEYKQQLILLRQELAQYKEELQKIREMLRSEIESNISQQLDTRRQIGKIQSELDKYISNSQRIRFFSGASARVQDAAAANEEANLSDVDDVELQPTPRQRRG